MTISTSTSTSIIATDALIMGISRLVGDSQAEDRRNPSHSNLDDLIVKH